MAMSVRGPSFLLTLLGLAACQGPQPPSFRVHHTLLTHERALPARVVVFAPDVQVLEISAGGQIEETPERSRASAIYLGEALRKALAARGLEVVAEPALAGEEAHRRGELVNRFRSAASATLPVQAGITNSADLRVWWTEIEHFDLWLGRELAFLRERTGCETAMVMACVTVDPTAGRAATTFLQSLLTGVAASEEGTQAYLALVDLASGDLLWMNGHVGSAAIADAGDAADVVAALLENYPGVEAYARYLSETREQLEEDG